MKPDIDAVLLVDPETFDWYLAFRDILSNKLGIDGSWIQVFSIDFEEIRSRLHVDTTPREKGWKSEHINKLPRALRQLKNLKLIKRLPRKNYLLAKKIFLRKGQIPKKLYTVQWAKSNCFFGFDGRPLLSTSILPARFFTSQKLQSEA